MGVNKRGMRHRIDQFVVDMRQQGRFNSPRTEDAYRATLDVHADDVGNRDPHDTNREDVKATLLRWKHPNTQRIRRAHMVSFYRWAMEEGIRKDNPAEQTRRPKPRPVIVYRMTLSEVGRFLDAAKTRREQRLAFLGVCAGLRNAELRGLQGRHFIRRPGFVWVSADIGKTGERYVPVVSDLAPVVAEILESTLPDEYVLPAQRFRDPGVNRDRADYAERPCSPQAVYYLARRLGERAKIEAPVHPHMMRHAFGDHLARAVDTRIAQFMLGHKSIGTTQTYLGKPTLDELANAVRGMAFTSPPPDGAGNALKAPTGIEPVQSPSRIVERFTGLLRAHGEFFREAVT